MQAPRDSATVYLIDYADDPLKLLAEQLLKEQQACLPDLSQITILLAEPRAAPRLRKLLLDKTAKLGYPALLGPRIMSLRDWVMQFVPADIQVCTPHSQELMLVDALNQHGSLLNAANPWTLSDNLLKLFNELTLNKITLPDNVEAFTQQLASAYGLTQQSISALGHEAVLVHSLWQAWHTQLHATGLVDPQTAYQLALKNSLQQPQQRSLYLAGFHQFHKAEAEWLFAMLLQDQARLFLHGEAGVAPLAYHPNAVLSRVLQQLQHVPHKPVAASSPYQHCLNTIFSSTEQTLQERARHFSRQHSASPLQKRISVFNAKGAEEEARAIDIQVRLWLLSGTKQIGIVTENRRLARRVRALLERADINLHDASGWALSTTSAAATLERWLECIEEDFAHQALLDLLKSPFIFYDLDHEQVRFAAFRLEQDIIQHENIARSLSRYRHHIQERRQRLPDWFRDTGQLLLELLQQVQQAADPLLESIQGHHPVSHFLHSLKTSLALLGMSNTFANDEAGSRLLQMLEQLQQGANTMPVNMSWSEFRTWLGRNLERFNFLPAGNSPVQLMGLSQSRLHRFDALIIAGAERDHLPGQPGQSPFFNDSVRRELGLQTHSELLAERFHHFRRLLQTAPQILITLREEQDGELIPASPWLENIQAFHKLAYGVALGASRLSTLVHRVETQVKCCDTDTLPARQQQPTPSIHAQQLPKQFSASSYQKLLNCPYQFYAAKCLNLAPPEEISLALSKSEYGQRVHKCLEAFHHPVEHLPGPFTTPLQPEQREAAITLMQHIAEHVFAQDLEDNFEHQSWFKQWQQMIPHYIDWQIVRNIQWRILEVEQQRKVELATSLPISGQLDRIDVTASGELAILDYKTGNVPKKNDVVNGEFIQLPFYALLENRHRKNKLVQQVAYLQLDKPESVNKHYQLEGDELTELADAIGERLSLLIQQLHNGKPLPAWGDSQTCKYCDITQLCRRQAWDNDKDYERH